LAVAVIFRTYWAIILGLVAGAATQLALSYALRPFSPRFSLASFDKVFGFTGWMTAVSIMAALNNKLDTPVLARAAGTGGAGVFFMGVQLTDMIADQLGAPLARALYPGLTSLQDEPERMRRAFLQGVAALGLIATPAAVGFAFVAEDAVTIVLGEQWRRVAMVIQWLAPVVALQSLFFAAQAYAIALGLTRLVFIREAVYFTVRFPLFVWACLHFGVEGAVWATAASGLFHVGLNLALYARASGGAFWEPLWSARRSLGGVAAMAAWFFWVRPAIPMFDGLPAPARLIADSAAGAWIYLAALSSLWVLEGRPDGPERRLWRLFAARGKGA
ncbi:MAG: oligosaccharide flippase family protein, partial [Hyphococcus sp.]